MQNAANTAPEKGEARKRNLRERAVGELKKYATITGISGSFLRCLACTRGKCCNSTG